VTLEPLLIQMYGDPSAKVIDLAAVDSEQLQRLLRSKETGGFIAVKEGDHQTSDDLDRYGDQLRYLDSLPTTELYRADDFTIQRVNGP